MQERPKKKAVMGQADPCPSGQNPCTGSHRESMLGGEPRPLERVYDDQILPLIDHIRALCAAHGIDHLMYFALDDDGDRFLAAGSAYIEREGLDHMRIAEGILRNGIDIAFTTSEQVPIPWGEA